MEYVVYCDESRQGNILANPYMAIGGIWVPRAEKKRLTSELNSLKKQVGLRAEAKWQKVTSSHLEGYKALIDFFYSNEDLRFRTIVVEQAKVNVAQYHDNDEELGFYKFYYEMLVKWVETGNEYLILLDYKTNKGADRYTKLAQVLRRSVAQNAVISDLTITNSAETPLCQLCDIFTGAIAASWSDGIQPGSAKFELARYIAKKSNLTSLKIEHKSPAPSKFNIFRINLG